MAVITDSNLRHVRKTVTLDGSANNGNLGDIVPLFTITGRVAVVSATAYASVALACTAPTVTLLYLRAGTVGTGANWLSLATDGEDFTGVTGFFNGATPAAAGVFEVRTAVSADIGLYVYDSGGGADVTAGTIIVDIWYLPITNDGALAGDDIDTGYIPVSVAQWNGSAVATPTVAGVPEVDLTHVAGATSNVAALATNVDAILTDTEDIQTRLPAALVGGRIDATIDATGMESGAIDAILTRTMTEAYAAAGAEMTVAQALYEICQVFSEFAISGSTITVKQRDGSTTAMTFTLDSAIQPTSRTRAT